MPVLVSTSFAAEDWRRGSDSAERNLMARRLRASSTDTADLSPATSDLTRLLAGIIVALATEPVHAHG